MIGDYNIVFFYENFILEFFYYNILGIVGIISSLI